MNRPLATLLCLATLWSAPVLAQHNAPGEAAPDKQRAEQTAADYAAQGQAQLQARLAMPARNGKAKNLIIFIGDGMGVSTAHRRAHLGGAEGGARWRIERDRDRCHALFGDGEDL